MLAALLQDEIAALSELRSSLFQEYAALKARNLSELEQLAIQKRACADRLQVLLEQQVHYLLQRGFRTDAGGARACIESSKPSDRLQLEPLWAALKEAATQAQQQNKINGAIIAASRGYVERALSILQGRDPQTCLYGQDAQTTFGGGLHSLAKV